MEARRVWIDEVVREQESRLASGKQRKHRVSTDGSIGKAEPPPVRMVADFAQDMAAKKRAAAAETSIAKAMAVADNKYMARYKDAVKGVQEAIEAETAAAEQVRAFEAEKSARMDAAGGLARDAEAKIAATLEAAKKTTNATAKGKALADVRKLHADRRTARAALVLEVSRRATDILVPRGPGKSGGAGDTMNLGAFHAEDNAFCFFC